MLKGVGLALLVVLMPVAVSANDDPRCELRPEFPQCQIEHTPTTSTTTTPPGERIGVIGCSNTDQHVAGYLLESKVDLLTKGDLGGGTLVRWALDERSYRDLYLSRRPTAGYDATWIQICLRTGEHLGSFDSDEKGWVATVVEWVRSVDPGIPIHVSPLNFFTGVCPVTGPDGSLIAAQTADWAVAHLGVIRGPDTGPLGGDQLVSDGCHLSGRGKRFVGKQLVTYFDGG